MNRFFVLVVFLVSIITTPFIVDAQSNGFSDQITILTIPEYPKPSEAMTLKVRSFSTDLDVAEFNWIVNGKTHQTGIGLKDIQVIMGKPGTPTVVSVVIKSRNGQTITETFSFKPADVTLVWEADTYKPPFYKGRSTAAFGSTFRITALPEFFDKKGIRMNPKDLVYTWKKNYETVSDASGYGKDSFTTTKKGYLQEDEIISVEVSSPRESITGSASVTISPKTPKILFYVNDPSQGIQFHKESGGQIISESDVEIYMVPFGISRPNNNSLINTEWRVGNIMLTDFSNKRDIVIDKRLENTLLSVQVKNNNKLMQLGTGSIFVSFKNAQ